MTRQDNQQVSRPDYLKLAIIRNLREARRELKHGFPISTDMYIEYCLSLITSKWLCDKCGCPMLIRNLSGVCEHLITKRRNKNVE